MSGFENFIGFNPWTALFTLLNMVLTFLILKKFLFKPVSRMIGDRQKEIDDLYSGAEEARTQAAALKSDYDARLAQAREESAQIIQSATQEANRRSDEILLQARAEADKLRRKAEADIEMERRKAYDEVRTDLSGIAVNIAEKVIGRELNLADEDRLFESFLHDIGGTQ